MSKGTALVTGAAIALRLADDGFNVAVNDLPAQADNLLEAKGRSSSLHLADVTVEEQVKAAIAEVAQVYDGIDVVMSVDEWDRIMAINCRGTFLCYKYAALQMIKQGRGGRIIGASSVAGKRGSAGLGVYSASKFAVRGLTQAAALEFGPHQITVNAYAPSAIDQTCGSLTFVKNAGALGRLGTSTDVAGLVSFIASKESRFITGTISCITFFQISVNGGMYFD
ncbi:short chain oxidoreductase [Mycena olivaceomarginata]|nr:short chain oxidoreductase [Mycena olivaceomarginata]